MTITITHTKVSAIADDSASAAAGEIVPSDWNANHTVNITALDNIPIGGTTPSTGTFTTMTANDKVTLKNGTAPTAGTADAVQVYSSDLRAGATIPSIFTESPIAAAVTATANRAIPIRINGTLYHLLASTVDYSTSPTIDLVFAGATSLDPAVTFTRASGGTYFNSSGVLTTASNDGPRLDYDPSTLAARGFLIEEQRTNSIRNNTMAGAVAGTPGTLPTNWTHTGGGLAANVIGTGVENGITYIDINFVGTATAGSSGLRCEGAFGVAASTGQTWSTSCFVRKVAGSTSGITNLTLNTTYFISTTASDQGSTTISSASLDESSISKNRPSVTVVAVAAGITTVRPQILFSHTIGNAVDITLRIGLPQLEQGAFATSVIPTTGSAATRSADVASVNTLSPWFNATEGTLYAEALLTRQAAIAGTGIVEINDGTSANKYGFFYRGSGATGTAGETSSVTQWDMSPTGVITANSVVKLAIAIKANDIATSGNGGTIVTDTSATVPSVNSMLFGNRTGGVVLNGYIRRISYYPRRLSNVELQAITT